MTLESQKFSSQDLNDRKRKAKELEQSIKADRRTFTPLLTVQFARAFGIELDDKLHEIVIRDLAQQPRARRQPLLDLLPSEEYRGWFQDKESLTLILALSWYTQVQKFHQGDHMGGTNLHHRQLIMMLNKCVSDQLTLNMKSIETKINFPGMDVAYDERMALQRFWAAAGQAFNSIRKMDHVLGLREPPHSSRRIKHQEDPSQNPVDFSRTA